jgi:uncharacterized protein (DUF1330 family)
MAKGYWIFASMFTMKRATRPTRWPVRPSARNSGGRYLVRSGRFTDVEGQSRSRNVVVEFPDYEAALACYHSAEYQQNLKIRKSYSTADFIVIEGFDGP